MADKQKKRPDGSLYPLTHNECQKGGHRSTPGDLSTCCDCGHPCKADASTCPDDWPY